jgi:hypothetical protein
MKQHYPFLAIAAMIISGFGIAGALIVVWMGWLRTRRKAYLLLAAWAFINMASQAISWSFWPLSQKMSINQEVAFQLMMCFNLGHALVSYLLLLAGFGLLVFSEPRTTRPQP